MLRAVQRRFFLNATVPSPAYRNLFAGVFSATTQLIPSTCLSSSPFQSVTANTQFPVVSQREAMCISPAARGASAARSHSTKPLLSFGGGGMFFYWQAGTVLALQDQYDMSQFEMTGASAGALAAVLAACDVDMREATELALHLAEKNGVLDRSAGLFGIWGRLIFEWLEILLPEDAVERCNGRCHIVVLEVPSLQRRVVSHFESKHDLITVCLASTHIPYFLNGSPAAFLRQDTMIDGSIFLKHPASIFGHVDEARGLVRCREAGTERPTLILNKSLDSEMARRALRVVSLTTFEGLQEMVRFGYAFISRARAQGQLDGLARAQRPLPLPRRPSMDAWITEEAAWEAAATPAPAPSQEVEAARCEQSEPRRVAVLEAANSVVSGWLVSTAAALLTTTAVIHVIVLNLRLSLTAPRSIACKHQPLPSEPRPTELDDVRIHT